MRTKGAISDTKLSSINQSVNQSVANQSVANHAMITLDSSEQTTISLASPYVRILA